MDLEQKGEEGCACDGTIVDTNRADGLRIGECLTGDKYGPNAPKKEHWCYVSKKECASAGALGETSRFTNKWVSYELCNCEDSADCNEQIIKFDK